MNYDACVHTLSMPLPEDILKRKWAGDLTGAMQAIELRLQQPMPDMLRRRLITEHERIRRLPTQYPWNRAEAIEKLRSLVPDVTDAEFDALEMQGQIDFIYIDGEKRYFVRFHRTLAKFPDMLRRAGKSVSPVSEWLDPMISTIIEKGSLTKRITLKTCAYVAKGHFTPGLYRAWVPMPALSAQQSDIELLDGDPDEIADENAPARTAYWQREMTEDARFPLTYRYTSCIRYADPLHAAAPAAPLYPNALPVCSDDLAEDGVFIRFTPYLRALAADLSANAQSDAEKAWRFYEFVTTQVNYSFMRDYFQIDNLGEYCAVNLKGDCGLQARLFIILCRIAGIPARWQSGLSIDPDYAGSHDWAQFYLPGWGWLFADPSYGGSAYRAGSTMRHHFYFGNLDPLRMAANRQYMAPLTPAMNTFRFDPYDNQNGEIELVNAPAPFTGRQIDFDGEMTECETLG